MRTRALIDMVIVLNFEAKNAYGPRDENRSR
jgi:hypothetical protein